MSETAGGSEARAPLIRLLLFLCIAASATFADLLTKWLAFSTLGEPGKSREVWLIKGFLGLRTSANYGSLFGLFQGAGWLLIPASFVALAVIVWVLFFREKRPDRATEYVLAFLSAGVVGNLYDRLVHGYVRDFIGLHAGSAFTWPYFNLADAYITVGILFLAVRSFFAKEEAGGQR